MVVEIQDTLVSMDIFTEYFFCNIDDCKGACCVEGDAGAPVLMEEINTLENATEEVWDQLTPQAQAVITEQGVVYPDPTGELVTSIIGGKDCVFARQDANGCTYCTIQKCKPISCSLYPIRLSQVGNMVALNYHRWEVCKAATTLGKVKDVKVYQFLKEPLIRRFGQEWYDEVLLVAKELEKVSFKR
ncbi:MAG: DUF3109 family protein [Prevotellaceae bacterium]|nr:DUF3109 family protein [Candidatus Colivivens equi]MCQ2076282.1 DUF3109 family protein [Bacteroidaceae bacterium]